VDVFIIKVFQDLVQKEKQIGGDQVEELVISTKYIVSNYYKSNILFKRKTEPWSMRSGTNILPMICPHSNLGYGVNRSPRENSEMTTGTGIVQKKNRLCLAF
jgi:hypothetical protein